jgi:hypothetical protein
MELSVPLVLGLIAAALSAISIILCVNLAGRIQAEKRADAPAEELIAVLGGAVAAATGTPASGLRIVSIEARGGFTTPVWGHAERPARGQNSITRG